MSIYDVFGGSQGFDKKKWAEKKQTQRKEAYETVEAMCQSMLQGGEAFQKYLDVQGRFDRYSVSNAILVAAVKPEALILKEFKEWRRQGVYVNKDAKQIVILEPGDTYTRNDGVKAVSYNPKELYDVSDTSMKKAEDVPRAEIRSLVSALIDASPVNFEVTEALKVGAYFDKEQNKIFVRKGLGEDQLFSSMAKEVAAAILSDKYPAMGDLDFKSYCISYMLSKKYDISTEGYNFDKLPERYAGLSPKELREELGSMKNVLMEIQLEMYRTLEKGSPAQKKEYSR